MNYIAANSIIDRVKRKLKSYYTAGLIDPTDFANQLRLALSYLGMDGEDLLETSVFIKNHKAYLPDGIITLKEVWLKPSHSDSSRSSTGETALYPMDYKKGVKASYRLTSGNTLEVDAAEGELRLVYSGSIDPSEMPMVPSEPVYQDYLVKRLVYEQLSDWSYNSETPGIERMMAKAAQELELAYAHALYQRKLPTQHSLVTNKLNRPKYFSF